MRYSRVSVYLQCEYVKSSDRTCVRLAPLIRYESRRASRVQSIAGMITRDIGFSPSRMRFSPIFYHFRLVHHSGTTKRTCLNRFRERRALFADDVAKKWPRPMSPLPRNGRNMECLSDAIMPINTCEMMKMAKKSPIGRLFSDQPV